MKYYPLFHRNKNFLAAHVRTKLLRNTYASICLEVILKESDQHTRRSNNCIVESMGKILFAVLTVHADLKASCLCVAEVGAGTDFKILLLARRPCLYVNGLDLQICKVTGAALKCADRNIQSAEQVDCVLPELIEPHRAVFRLADNDHFLLLELVNSVDAALFDTVSTFSLRKHGE